MAFDSFTSNWQSELFSVYKMSTIQMMFGANLFSCLFKVWSMIEGANFLSAVGFMMSHPEFAYHATTLSLTSATGQLFLFYTTQSFGPVVLTISSSWPLEWCWVSCCRALFIIIHCLLKLFWGLLLCLMPCVCMLGIAQNHLPRGNCLYQGNVISDIRKECWLTLLITADYCYVTMLNFQRHSFNLSVKFCTL